MVIVWDEVKRAANLLKHGLDFAAAEAEFDFATAREFEAYTSRTGRTRFALIGRMGGVFVVVVILSPLGEEALSVISLRRANPKERRLHGF